MAYSIDLRTRVLKYLRENQTALLQDVVKIFGVSDDTIRRWIKIYNETGHVERKIRKDFSMQLKVDFEALKKYCEEQGEDFSVLKASEYFKVSDITIYNCFKRNNYSYKKK
jgi:transposase